jgi:hypothetical protein
VKDGVSLGKGSQAVDAGSKLSICPIVVIVKKRYPFTNCGLHSTLACHCRAPWCFIPENAYTLINKRQLTHHGWHRAIIDDDDLK